ncbi:FMN-binding protein [Natranaerobius thermophilus]|uniref:Ion-translocating oxidoreductase complex subunit G n=1 Tax=Natranaerobius thermophilus (strain ATCC BAA-1301 / DSM 18059 / JW/NM-WN-LF) TaxID=457570 RepID=B2A144_NATTJ|nr:RnfABCDGE type electron transport complex subunit G [Natranaerobius thermophilus]ACB84667.1 electron transport complex, RnfABCDGE type, G subunit [Natranaerobius thermophilus JW/NM-WN-LF]
MKASNVLRLSMILTLVTLLAATVLGFSFVYTEPLIWEQRMEQLEDAMFKFFPEADQFEIEEVNDDEFYVVEKDDETIGAAALTNPSGYGGEIEMMVAVDIDGEIRGIEILGHSETPGLGDKIENEEWQTQFIGLTVVDEIQIGVDVDVISGATVSSQGVTRGVEKGVEKVAITYFQKDPEELEEIEEAPKVLEDGVFTGEGTGRNPGIEVEVTVEEGEITDIELLDHDESDAYMDEAWEGMVDKIKEANCPDVDSVSGATQSSVGIKDAVEDAIEEREEEFEDGVARGEGTGRNPGVVVEVTVQDGEITELELLEHDDSDSYMNQAWDDMRERILEEQSTDVDTVSGATQSSVGIINAVEEALEQESE